MAKQLQTDPRTGRVIRAARAVGDGAHDARREVVPAAASDRRSLLALCGEPRAAIGAAMRSSSRFNAQWSPAPKPPQSSLRVARGDRMVTGTGGERGDMR